MRLLRPPSGPVTPTSRRAVSGAQLGIQSPAAADQARRAMGLGAEPLTLERLKSRYKQLMKRFHPDVNPSGLRRCQEINVAYSTLVATTR